MLQHVCVSNWSLKVSAPHATHGIIGIHRPPPKILGPPLIYLVGPLAILASHINICVGPPNTCVALKQFNLLPPNTLL